VLRRVSVGMAVAGCVLLTGCFHQVVSTGMAPGTTVVARPWTSTWIFGLVEAKPINVRQECPGGLAFVASKMTFLNGLVAGLTLGIWTPQDVTITCAAGRASLDASVIQLPLGASVAESVALAARASAARGVPVALVWEPTSTLQTEAAR
jgi:hypothetical protein